MDEKTFVAPPDPRIGTVVRERYRIVRLLGEGGMGAVYEGEHLLIRRRCAIKFLHAQYARTPAAMTRFRREALAATSVGNPHVVEVTDMDQAEDGSPFMVLEYLEGLSLAEEVEAYGPMTLSRAFHVMRQLCYALGDVHAKGITHRDLKPENLFLVRHGNDRDFLKILDFGISKFASSDDGSTVNLTKTGAAVGSVYFMSPEQARGRSDVDPRADIYAVGGVFFYLLTGRPVFEGDSLTHLLMQIVSDPPPQLSFLRPDVSPSLEACVLRMLAKDREERFENCATLWDTLTPHAEEAERASLPVPPRVNTAVLPRHVSPAPAHTPLPSALQSSDDAGAAAQRLPASTLHTRIRRFGSYLPWLLFGVGAVLFFVVRERGAPVAEAAKAPLKAEPALAAPSEATVSLTVRVFPGDAALYLGGKRVTNPFAGRFAKSTSAMRVEASLDRHDPLVREFLLDQDRDLTFELVPTLAAPEPEVMVRTSSSKPARKSAHRDASPTLPEPPAAVSAMEVVAPAPAPTAAQAPANAGPQAEKPRDIKRIRF